MKLLRFSKGIDPLEFSEEPLNENPKKQTKFVEKKSVSKVDSSPKLVLENEDNFFKKLTINEIENIGKTFPSPTVDNIEVIEEFIKKNKLSAFVAKVLYNDEDEEFIIKFKNDIIDESSCFERFQFKEEGDIMYRKFKIFPLFQFKTIDAERIERKGGLNS